MNKEKEIRNILKKIFRISEDKINTLNFKDNIWDSIKHISLILEIERVFKIKIDNTYIEKFDSFSNIKKILTKHYHIKF